jgi:hypothetical protein
MEEAVLPWELSDSCRISGVSWLRPSVLPTSLPPASPYFTAFALCSSLFADLFGCAVRRVRTGDSFLLR